MFHHTSVKIKKKEYIIYAKYHRTIMKNNNPIVILGDFNFI